MKIQYQLNNNWLDLPGINIDLSRMTTGWQSFDISSNNIATSKLRVVLNGRQIMGGIKEIEIWGYRNAVTGSSYYYSSGVPVALSSDVSANYSFNLTGVSSGTFNLHVTGSGVAANLTWELNGRSLGNLTPSAVQNGTAFYHTTIDIRRLQTGTNFIRINGSGLTVSDCRIEKTTAYSLEAADSALTDRWLLTAVSGNDYLINLGSNYHLDQLVLQYLGNQPTVQVTILQDSQWVTLSGPSSNLSDNLGGQLIYSGVGKASQIRVTFDTAAAGNGPSEILLYGSAINDGVPTIKITSPLDGDVFTLSQWGQGTFCATIDNPDVTLKINGQAIYFTGTTITLPLPQLGNPQGEQVIEAVVTNSQGRTGSDKITISVSTPPDFTVNLPDQITYTSASQITISGTVIIPTSRITINGTAVTVQNNKFSTVYSLKEGLNLLTIKLVPSAGSTLTNTLVRKVVRTSSGPYLKIQYPADGQVVNSSKITISGEVSSLLPVTVTVNGKAATIGSGSFYSSPISLVEGANKLTVIATDQNGRSSTAVLTVRRDGTAPVLSGITPVEGANLNTLTVTVSGKVSDANPVSVLINGLAATVVSSQFNATVAVQEGANTLKIQATDSAGNATTLTRNILIDTVAPAGFTPTANPSGWTNNSKPTISFSTTDSASGIDHYEIGLEGGTTGGPVTSPYTFTTAIADGEHTVQVKAIDKAGNIRIGEVKVYIDTTEPDVPKNLRVIPGNGCITVKWDTSSTDVVKYFVERLPAGSSSPYTVKTNELVESGLENGIIYQYRVWAIDHAGNQCEPTTWKEAMVGLAEASYVPAKGAIVEFNNVTLAVPKNLSETIQDIQISEVESPKMEAKASYQIIGPIYEFSATFSNGQTTQDLDHMVFAENYIGTLTYDPADVPEGFPEQNLGVYYYDQMWGRWFRVEQSGVDTENNTIYFVTNHFTSFSVQPTMIEDLSPQELKDASHSPLKTASTHGAVSVSPEGGTSMIETTEFVLPGRNGFDFVLKRMYDSATARGDCPGLTANAALGLSSKSLANIAQLAGQILNSAEISLGTELESMIKKYFQNNGDYAYTMGLGWRLNLPYIRGSNSSILLRLANGSFHSMDSLNLSSDSNETGTYRTLKFENRSGEDFTLSVTQVRGDVSVTGLVTGSKTIPDWTILSAKLVMKDGTTYEMDALGRTTKIIDPTGLNTIELNYTGPTLNGFGLELDYIKDSMGRKIHFAYDESFIIPKINKIWIENDTRTVNYTVRSQVGDGGQLFPLLVKAKDVGGREYNYDYGYNFLFSGGAGIKVNILATILDICSYGITGLFMDDVTLSGNLQCEWVFSLTGATGPGIGYTKIAYRQKELIYDCTSFTDYFLGFIPVSVQYKFQMLQRLMVNTVDVYLSRSSSSPLQTTSYDYDFQYAGHEQFYNRQTIENDGWKKITYTYNKTTKKNIRYIDFSDYAVDIINGMIAGGANFLNGLFLEDPYAYEVVTYPNEKLIYDVSSGDLLERYIYQYNTDTMRPTEENVYHGSNYTKKNYTYDNWNNVTSNSEFSVSNGRINQMKTYLYYLATDSTPSTDVSWQSSPYSKPQLSRERHDLLYGQAVANYTPKTDGSDEKNYLYSYNQYNSLGEQTGEAKWDGAEWLSTEYEYHPTFGSVTKKTDAEGHETDYEYDQYGLPSAVTEKSVVNAAGETTDVVTKTGYQYITGWKLWEQNPKGYVTEYEYDSLGRTTKITAPDDDDTAYWVPAGIPGFRENNPVTMIAYDDQALTSLITDPLNNRIMYDFDNLGRLEKLIKYCRNNSQYTEAAVTTVQYDGRGNITAITDPNGNAGGADYQYTTRYEYDALNRNTAIIYPDDTADLSDNPRKKIQYSDNKISTLDERNNKTYEETDMQGRVIYQSKSLTGRIITTTKYYDGLGNEVITVDPKGSTTVKTYNVLNLLTKLELPAEDFWENGAQVNVSPYQKFQYNKVGQKTAEISSMPDGESTVSLDPDALGRIIRSTTNYTDNGTTKTAVTETYYDANGNKIKLIDANNTPLAREEQKKFEYAYSAADKLIGETDPSGNMTAYTYDAAGNRLSMTDPRGNSGKYSGDFTIVYEYDSLYRLIKGYLPAGSGQTTKPVVSLNYDARGNLIKRTEPDGGTTTYTYWPRNLVKTVTVAGDGGSYTTTHKYDVAGNETATIDAKGNSTVKEYDGFNRLTRVVYPESNDEQYEYDVNNNRTAFIDGRSYRTSYIYDRYNHLSKVTDPLGGTTQYNYDRWGNMTRTVNPLQYTSSYKYDELNRLLLEKDPQGYIKQYRYDAAGNRIWSKDPNGTVSGYEYYPNNLVKQITLANSNKSTIIAYQYDEAGYRNQVSNGSVVTEYNTYNGEYIPNPFGRINRESKSFGGSTLTVDYQYDLMGRVTGITYPTGQTVGYQYNNLGQLVKVPGYVDEKPAYDAGGLIKGLQAANGVNTAWEYDKNDRLTALNYSNQGSNLKNYALQYDGSNNITKRNDDIFHYDALNQLLYANLKGNFEIDPNEEQQSVGLVREDITGGKPLEFAIDQSELTELDYNSGSIGVDLLAPVKITKIALTPQSPIHQVTAENTGVFYSSDNLSYSEATGWKLVANEKGALEITLKDPVTARYIKVLSYYHIRDNQFNPIDKATFKNTPQDMIKVYYLVTTRQEDYLYNANGDRTSERITERNATSRTYQYYANSSRLKTNGKYNFEYDNNGNLTKKTEISTGTIWVYEYDLLNRLNSVFKDGKPVAEYVYDEAGLRVKKDSTDATTYYVFDIDGNVIYEQENKGYMEYVYVLGKHFARVDGSLSDSTIKKYFYHTDHLGSTVLVTDESGQQVWSAEYTPFGKQTAVDGELEHAAKFTGKDLDEDTGLYYFNARWYDQEIGRFISEDPIQEQWIQEVNKHNTSAINLIIKNVMSKEKQEKVGNESEKSIDGENDLAETETNDIVEPQNGKQDSARVRYFNSIVNKNILIDPKDDGSNWYLYCENNPINRIDPSGLRFYRTGVPYFPPNSQRTETMRRVVEGLPDVIDYGSTVIKGIGIGVRAPYRTTPDYRGITDKIKKYYQETHTPTMGAGPRPATIGTPYSTIGPH